MSGNTAAAPAANARASRLLALAVAAVALWIGADVLSRWAGAGTVPGARTLVDTTPLGVGAVLAVLVVVAFVRRAALERCALAGLSWAFAVSVIAELPTVAKSHEFCDGPALRWLYLGLGLGAGLWALCSRLDDTRRIGIALLVYWSAANARLWGRDADRIWILLWAALLLTWGARGEWRALRDVAAATGRKWIALVVLLLVWFALASAGSDSPTISFTAWLRVAWGALFAVVLACSGREALQSVWGGLLAGAFSVVLVLAVGWTEAASFNSLERVLGSRLRLLGMHSNGIGPFLALCLCVGAAELLREWRGGPRRLTRTAAWLVVCGGCAFGLLRSESRASTLGVALGLAALAWCLWMSAPRQTWKFGLAALGLLALGLAFLATPLAAPLHARLNALTLTQSALGQRYYLWKLAARVLADDPLFGAGPNVYYLHAQYAEPSFYDLTPQVLHSHSLYVGIAEGSGWIGIALFLLLVLATFELLRRRVWSTDVGANDRILLAGICAALVAILASGLLDVGQGRNTFVPLMLWIALGSAAAAHPARSVARAPTRIAWGGVLLLLPLCVSPGLSMHYAAAAREHLELGRPKSVLFAAGTALQLWPLDPEVRQTLYASMRGFDDAQPALKQMRALAATRPGSASYQLNLARAELELGDAARAKTAALEALRLDPLGQDSGEAAFALAGALLRLADRDGAQAALLQGLRTEGSGWRTLPQIRVPQRAGSGEGSHRIAFLLGDPAAPSGQIELEALLAQLENEVRDLSTSQPLQARRLVGRVLDLLRELGLPQRALALLDEFERVTKFKNSSFEMQRIEICAELGRVEDVEALRRQTVWGNDSHIVSVWARALLAAGGAERAERVLAEAPLLESFTQRDISFEAGKVALPLALAAQLALQRGDGAHALELLRRARYDCAGPAARLGLAQSFLALCAKIGVPAPTALAALGEVLFDASLQQRSARDEQAMRQRAKLLRQACGAAEPSADELQRLCGAHGEAGATFLRVYPSRTED
jgi:O-antigen ligase/tetratricopeptide (TPR) repeat protein